MIQALENSGSMPGGPLAPANPQAIVELQWSYYQGEIPYEAALAAAALLSGLTAEESEKLFPRVPPVTPTPVEQMRQLVGSFFLGIVFGLILGPMAAASVHEIVTGQRIADAGIGLAAVAGAVLGGVLGIVLLFVFRRLSGYSRPMYLPPEAVGPRCTGQTQPAG